MLIIEGSSRKFIGVPLRVLGAKTNYALPRKENKLRSDERRGLSVSVVVPDTLAKWLIVPTHLSLPLQRTVASMPDVFIMQW